MAKVHDWTTSDGRPGEEWEATHQDRIMELNDMLWALDLKGRRVLYASFTHDEREGLMTEYIARKVDASAPVGSLVVPFVDKFGFSFTARVRDGAVLHGSHAGLALVVGSEGHGLSRRDVMLVPPWQDKEGNIVYFARTCETQLRVIGEAHRV